MINEVIKDILPFMVIFVVFIFAFSNAQYAVQDIPEENYIDNFWQAIIFTYNTNLGLRAEDDHDTFMPYLLFVLITFVNLIVMLNLLIAIISDTYARVSVTQIQEAYKQKCEVIADCRDFPLYKLWMVERKPCQYLFIAISEDIETAHKK